MAVSTLALDGPSYRFLGYGCHSPLYEKGYPLRNYAGDLSSGQFASLCDDLSIYPWVRVLVGGGEFYRPNPGGTRRYMARKQAMLAARLFDLAGSKRVIVTPFSAPPIAQSGGMDSTRGMNQAIASAGFHAYCDYLATTGAAQAWLEEISASITSLLSMGLAVEYVGTPSECAGLFVQNHWATILTAAQFLAWVKQVYLGQGLSGGGLKDRFPWLKLIIDDTAADNTPFRSAIIGDAAALAASDAWGYHPYGDGFTWEGGSPQYGKGALAEYGYFTPSQGTYATADLRPVARTSQQAVAYAKCPIANYWTSLRDVAVKATADGRGTLYTAKPTHNLNTAAGTCARLPYHWIMRAHALACGKGEADSLLAGGTVDLTPRTGTYISAFHRVGYGSVNDGKWAILYANFSGSAQSDAVAFTSGGIPAGLSGTRKDFAVQAGTESTTSAVSTSSGSIDLGSVADATMVLLELS